MVSSQGFQPWNIGSTPLGNIGLNGTHEKNVTMFPSTNSRSQPSQGWNISANLFGNILTRLGKPKNSPFSKTFLGKDKRYVWH